MYNFLDILKNYARLQTLGNRVIQFRICSQMILQSDNVIVDGYLFWILPDFPININLT